MKLTHNDKLIIEIKNFMDYITEHCKDIEDICFSISAKGIDEWGENNKFSPKNGIFPLRVTVIHNGHVSKYRFNEKNECDDEYAIMLKNGDSINYWDFKKEIMRNCPALLNGKSYLSRNIIHFDNIDDLLKEPLCKTQVVSLNNELKSNNAITRKQNHKI